MDVRQFVQSFPLSCHRCSACGLSYLCVWMMVEHVHLDLLGWGRRCPGHTTFLYHWFNFWKSICSVVFLWWCRQAHLLFFSSRKGEAADVSELDGNIMATATSLQPIALQTGAPGFYTGVKRTGWPNDTSGYCFHNKGTWSVDQRCGCKSVSLRILVHQFSRSTYKTSEGSESALRPLRKGGGTIKGFLCMLYSARGIKSKGFNRSSPNNMFLFWRHGHLLPVCSCVSLCVLTFLSPVCAPQIPAGSRGPRPTEQTPPSLMDWWQSSSASVMEVCVCVRTGSRLEATGPYTGIQQSSGPGELRRWPE